MILSDHCESHKWRGLEIVGHSLDDRAEGSLPPVETKNVVLPADPSAVGANF
jgi:hypothetical protein